MQAQKPAAAVSLEMRCQDQELAISRLEGEAQALRDENADLVAQLALARRPRAFTHGMDRLEATLPVSPDAPATARAAMTHWLGGQVPGDVLDDARLLASELVTNSLGHAEVSDEAAVRIAVQLAGGALRVEVCDPGDGGTVAPRVASDATGGFGLHLVERLATRWGVNRTGGTRVWFEMDAVGATD